MGFSAGERSIRESSASKADPRPRARWVILETLRLRHDAELLAFGVSGAAALAHKISASSAQWLSRKDVSNVPGTAILALKISIAFSGELVWLSP